MLQQNMVVVSVFERVSTKESTIVIKLLASFNLNKMYLLFLNISFILLVTLLLFTSILSLDFVIIMCKLLFAGLLLVIVELLFER
jgi:hypothetical protein